MACNERNSFKFITYFHSPRLYSFKIHKIELNHKSVQGRDRERESNVCLTRNDIIFSEIIDSPISVSVRERKEASLSPGDYISAQATFTQCKTLFSFAVFSCIKSAFSGSLFCEWKYEKSANKEYKMGLEQSDKMKAICVLPRRDIILYNGKLSRC